jgi:opacity protein-like surface antigen
MRFHKAWFAAAFVLACGSAPAWAGDLGIREVGAPVPVPVPAPMPVPTFDADSDWYVGLAIGANLSQSASIRDTDIDYLGAESPGVWARDSGDMGASPIFGLNFGRYITPSLRAEIAVDYSPDAKISKDGKLGYIVTNSAPNFDPGVGGIDTNGYLVSRTDTVKLSRTTMLVNLIYDIHTGTRFTPYIGGGIGFTWRKLRRNYTESATCIGATNSLDPGLYPPGDCSGNTSLPPDGSTVSGSDTKEQLDFAAAVQAGISYNITDSIVWDNGWQMLWEDNAIASSAPSASGTNKIVFKDSVLQQFRSGLRIKFN